MNEFITTNVTSSSLAPLTSEVFNTYANQLIAQKLANTQILISYAVNYYGKPQPSAKQIAEVNAKFNDLWQ